MIIAVDGPAGAGKSTVAKILAKKMKFLYIDTGAMYRALTLKVINKKIDVVDSSAITKLAKHTSISLIPTAQGPAKVLLDNKNVSLAIRQPQVTKIVSDIAKIGPVRKIMVRLQRKLGKTKDCVLDGRDIGTVVFPKADKKFFIDAAFSERVKRRYRDLINLRISGVSLKKVAEDLKNRDTIDSTRKVSPLKIAKDAVYIDTTKLSIEQVVDKMLGFVGHK
jgi:CMP/dCMP kinase